MRNANSNSYSVVAGGYTNTVSGNYSYIALQPDAQVDAPPIKHVDNHYAYQFMYIGMILSVVLTAVVWFMRMIRADIITVSNKIGE